MPSLAATRLASPLPLALAGLAFLAARALGIAPSLGTLPDLLAAAGCLSLLPGHLTALFLARSGVTRAFAGPGTSSAHAVASAYLLTLPWTLVANALAVETGRNIRQVLVAALALLALGCLTSLRARRRAFDQAGVDAARTPQPQPPQPPTGRPAPTGSACLAALALGVATLLAFEVGGPVGGEEVVELIVARKLAENPVLAPDNVMHKPETVPTYYYSPLEFNVALLAEATGADVIVVHSKFRGLLCLLAICAFAAWTCSFLPGPTFWSDLLVTAGAAIAFLAPQAIGYDLGLFVPPGFRGGIAIGILLPALLAAAVRASGAAENDATVPGTAQSRPARWFESAALTAAFVPILFIHTSDAPEAVAALACMAVASWLARRRAAARSLAVLAASTLAALFAFRVFHHGAVPYVATKPILTGGWSDFERCCRDPVWAWTHVSYLHHLAPWVVRRVLYFGIAAAPLLFLARGAPSLPLLVAAAWVPILALRVPWVSTLYIKLSVISSLDNYPGLAALAFGSIVALAAASCGLGIDRAAALVLANRPAALRALATLGVAVLLAALGTGIAVGADPLVEAASLDKFLYFFAAACLVAPLVARRWPRLILPAPGEAVPSRPWLAGLAFLAVFLAAFRVPDATLHTPGKTLLELVRERRADITDLDGYFGGGGGLDRTKPPVLLSWDAVKFLRDSPEVRPRSMVLADPVSIFALPTFVNHSIPHEGTSFVNSTDPAAYTDRYVNGGGPGGGPPPIGHPLFELSRSVLLPEEEQFLREFGVEYVAVPRAFREHVTALLGTRPYARLLYDRDGCQVWEIDRAKLGS
ncbi:MAG: hypothetical protein HYZ53_05075 [Planctomycetes bacterium]|nr:hypothetical protein [Planctomycetota bacterium]